jgi:hypothetical protein
MAVAAKSAQLLISKKIPNWQNMTIWLKGGGGIAIVDLSFQADHAGSSVEQVTQAKRPKRSLS